MEVVTRELNDQNFLDNDLININLERTLGLILGATGNINMEIGVDDIIKFNRVLSMLIDKSESIQNKNKIAIIFDNSIDDTSWRKYYNYNSAKKSFTLKDEYKGKVREYLLKVKREIISWFIIKAHISEENALGSLFENAGKSLEEEKQYKKVI